MSNGLASFAVGFGGSYLNAQRQGELDKERQEDRQIRLADVQWNQKQRAKSDALDAGLADAARPVTVESGAGGMIRPETMDNRDVGLPENASQPNNGLSLSQYRVKDKSYETQALADTAAAAQNAPAAVTGRLAQAYSLAGKPVEAITLQRDQTKYDREQNAFAAQARQEGLTQTAQVMLGGDAQQVFDTYNKQGQSKLKELPKVTRSEIDVPGVGKMPNYTYSGILVDASGKETPLNISSHDANMGLLKYKDILELGIKGNDSTVKQQKMLGDIANATEKNRLTGEATVAKTEAAAAKAAAAAAAAKGKPLAGAVLKQLQEVRDNATTIGNLQTSFKDDFASKGVFGLGADASMGAKAVMGTDKDSVAWWKDYRKQAELVERHSMFGASLTPGEQASWRSADIAPGMDKEVIKTNLATRATLTKRIHENSRQDFIDAGHDEGRVNAISGRGATNTTTEEAAKPGATKSVNIGGAAMEARQAPDGKYYVKQANGKFAEVRN